MQNGKKTVVSNIPFTIEPLRVMREMKIPHLKSLEEIPEKPLADSIRKAIDTGYSLIHGKGVYATYSLSPEGDEPDLTGLFSGEKIVKLMTECDYVTLLVCTIGPDLETEVEKLQEKDGMSSAYSLEMVGGWMADYMADRLDERIERDIVKAGYGRTMRFSPGYGSWDLSSQPMLLNLAGAEKIGVALTDTNIMIPRKSVSAVIGWQRKS